MRIRRKKQRIPSIDKPNKTFNVPPWETTVEKMYDKGLRCSEGKKILQVIYSNDKSMRYVVIVNDEGLITYEFQQLIPFDEYELSLLPWDSDCPPAFWGPIIHSNPSFFDSLDDCRNEIESEPEYKQYF